MATRGLPGFVDHPAGFLDAQRAGLFRAQCVGVVDGDTYDVVLDLGFRQYALVTLRLRGVDTPELNSGSEEERAAGRAARARVKQMLLGRHVLVRSYKDRQTFGRYVADIWVGAEQDLPAGAAGPADDGGVLLIGEGEHVWRPLAGILLAEGLGVPADR